MATGQLPYEIVTEYLLGLVENGTPGDKLPSVRELRNKYGFATVTIDKAYKALINRGLVETVSGRGSFIKSQGGRGFTSGDLSENKDSVVIIHRDFYSYSIWVVVNELERLCMLNGYHLIAYKMSENNNISELISFVKKQKNVKGVLLKGMEDLFHGQIEALNSLMVPVVLLDRGVESLESFKYIYSITPDSELSGYKMAKTLLEYGHEKLCYVQTDTRQFITIHAAHLKGIKRALREAKLPVRSLKVISDQKSDARALESGYLLIKENIKVATDVSGLIFSSSLSAFSGMKALAEAGIRIPRDISVIGEGLYEFISYSRPALSASFFNRKKMAELGLGIIMKKGKRLKKQLIEPAIDLAESVSEFQGISCFPE